MPLETTRPSRIYYTIVPGQDREIYLSAEYDTDLVAEFKRLVKELARSKRYGTRLASRDLIAVDNLPLALRQTLVAHDLVEATADEKIPTLEVLVREFKRSRRGNKDGTLKHDHRVSGYLLEYFGKNKRIDQIKPSDASGIRAYLMEERKVGKGCLGRSSANRAITGFKMVFRYAIDCHYLDANPFQKVKAGATTNRKRQEYVSEALLNAATEASGHWEFAAMLSFCRDAGLRIGETMKLRFADFDFETNIFTVHEEGKTGTRRVPIFDRVKPHFQRLKDAAKPGQEDLFHVYRFCTNSGTVIKKRMLKAGLVPWQKFFVNLRSSLITDKERLGWPESVMNAVFGNTKDVRIGHYVQPMPDAQYGRLGGGMGNLPEQLPILTNSLQPNEVERATVAEKVSGDSSGISPEKEAGLVLNAVNKMVPLKRQLFWRFCKEVPTLEKVVVFEIVLAQGLIRDTVDLNDAELQEYELWESQKKRQDKTSCQEEIMGGTGFEPVTSAV